MYPGKAPAVLALLEDAGAIKIDADKSVCHINVSHQSGIRLIDAIERME
jgi:hypothetical protein